MFTSTSGTWLSVGSLDRIMNVYTQVNQPPSSQTKTMREIERQYALINGPFRDLARKLEKAEITSSKQKSSIDEQIHNALATIKVGIHTPIIKLSLGGFDTHRGQIARHKKLLGKLGSTLQSLRSELVNMNEWDNTVVVSHSEFGRRVKENNNGGTDHGTAAAHLILGGRVKGGFYGDFPDLTNLIKSLYDVILKDWFEIPHNKFSQYRDERLSSLIRV